MDSAPHVAVVEFTARTGFEYGVNIAFATSSPDAVFALASEHHAAKNCIMDSGLRSIFLGDGLDLIPQLVGDGMITRGPAAAAWVLAAPEEHASETYELTGPQSLSMHDVAQILGDARDCNITSATRASPKPMRPVPNAMRRCSCSMPAPALRGHRQ